MADHGDGVPTTVTQPVDEPSRRARGWRLMIREDCAPCTRPRGESSDRIQTLHRSIPVGCAIHGSLDKCNLFVRTFDRRRRLRGPGSAGAHQSRVHSRAGDLAATDRSEQRPAANQTLRHASLSRAFYWGAGAGAAARARRRRQLRRWCAWWRRTGIVARRWRVATWVARRRRRHARGHHRRIPCGRKPGRKGRHAVRKHRRRRCS